MKWERDGIMMLITIMMVLMIMITAVGGDNVSN